ncbi:MAG: LamG-like jellyroll fold domain-containing protein [Ignavibacteria bacterium]
MRLLLVVLAALCVSAQGQVFERYESNPSHAQSPWYQLFKQPDANYYELLRLLRADSTLHGGRPSKEARKVLTWLARMRPYIDQMGNVGPLHSSEQDVQHFLTKSFPPKLEESTQRVDKTWMPIGPFGWDTLAKMATGSQGIGVLRSHIVDPTNSSVVLAGGISSGIWRSIDAGMTWSNLALNSAIKTVWRFAWSGKTVMAATSDGLYASQDRGLTWNKLALQGDALGYTAMAVDIVAIAPIDPQRIVIAAVNRLYTSTNGGGSWRQSCNFEGTWWDLRWHPTKNDVCYGLVQQGAHIGFIRSTSGAVKFDAVGNGYPQPKPNHKMVRALLATTQALPDMVAVAIGGSLADTISGTYGIYVSTDQGSTFESRCCGASDGPEPANKVTNPNLFDYDIGGNGLGQITWDMGFAVSSSDPSLMVVAGIFPYRSTNGGRSWSELPAMHYDVQSVSIRGDSIWITTDGGIRMSPDRGNTFLERSFGISATEVWGFDQSHDGDIMTIGAYHLPTTIRDTAIYMKSQPVDGWYAWSGADAMGANINPIATQWLYAKPWSSVRGKRTASRNVPPSATELGIDLGYITMDNINVDPLRYLTLYAIDYQHDRVVVSRDNASSWQEVKKFTNWAYRLRVHPVNPNVQTVFGDGALWHTTDAGSSWKNITPASTITRGRGMCDVAFCDDDQSTLYLAFSGVQKQVKVAKSTDAGATWTDLSAGLPEAAMRTMIYRRGTRHDLYAGTDAGVYHYTPITGWVLYGTGLPLAETHTLHINERHGFLRVATDRGLWQIDLPSTAAPRAQISLDIDTVRCSRIPVRFGCRSAALETIAFKRTWKFEAGQPATSSAPTVQVYYDKPGTYDVELIVENANGTDTMRINDAVTVLQSECDGIDPVPGLAADLTDPDDHVTLGRFDGPAKEFSFTAWVKPKGMQPGFSAILCTDADAGVSQEIGMQFVNDKNELGYLWTGGQWWWGSGLRVEPDVWSHVALTIDSNGATVYVNGYPSTNAVKLSPLQLSSLVFKLGTYHYWSSRNFSGLIDEVSLYSRKLSQDEVRRLMHLVRLTNETELLGYYQFNESQGSVLFDKKSGRDGQLESGASRTYSGALVGPGAAQVITTADTAGSISFSRHGLDLTFTQTLPANTTVAVTRLYVLPDTAFRSKQTLLGSWYVIDSYTLDKRPLELVDASFTCDSLFDKGQGSGRRFDLQSRQQWDISTAFSTALLPKGLSYNGTDHVLAAQQIGRGMLTPHQICIGYNGSILDVDDDIISQNAPHVWCHDKLIIIDHPEHAADIEIADVTGRRLYNGVAISDTQMSIDVSDYPSGVYVVRIGRRAALVRIAN